MCCTTTLLEVSVFVFSFAPFLDLIEMPPRKQSLQAHTVVTNFYLVVVWAIYSSFVYSYSTTPLCRLELFRLNIPEGLHW